MIVEKDIITIIDLFSIKKIEKIILKIVIIILTKKFKRVIQKIVIIILIKIEKIRIIISKFEKKVLLITLQEIVKMILIIIF